MTMKYVGLMFLITGLVMFTSAFYMLTLDTPPFGLTVEWFSKVKNANVVGGLIFTVGAGFAFILQGVMDRS